MVYDAVSRGLLSDFHSIALLSRKGAAVCLAKSGCDLSGGYRHCLRRWRHFRGDLVIPQNYHSDRITLRGAGQCTGNSSRSDPPTGSQ